ncbi:hypothetical protein ABZ234_08665 [Nocardiopsis sp. NPDC006198]|uniref:hypothetical protein n=1 Tax=Nocardiopsis sp. NPDC006198 TaxID=3154472 RepID=UPI0033B9781C
MSEQMSGPQERTVQQALAAEVARARNTRVDYWHDYRGRTLEPYSEAIGIACEVSGAEPDTAEHTAAWLVLVLAGHTGTPLVSAPVREPDQGRGLSMGRYLKEALGTHDPLGGHSVASRTRQLYRATTGYAHLDQGHLLKEVTDLIRVGTKTTDRRPDPLRLHHDLVALFGGRGRQAVHEAVRGWYTDLLTGRRS